MFRTHWRWLAYSSGCWFCSSFLRTDAAKRYKRVDRAMAVMWKMLMIAEQRFRRLKAPELMEEVYLGAQYVNGIATKPESTEGHGRTA